MTFLWLTRFAPYPPLRGGDIEYSRELLHSLARAAKVQVLAYAVDGVTVPQDTPMAWELLPYRRPAPWRGFMTSLPDVAFRFKSDAYLERAIALAAQAEAVFVDFIGMAWLVKPLRAALRAKGITIPVIMITHNHEGAMRLQAARSAAFPRRLLLHFDASKAARLEQDSNRIADGVTGIIQEDVDAFRLQCDTPTKVILPGYRGAMRAVRSVTEATPRRATIIGNRNSSHKVAVLDHALAIFSAMGTDKQVALEVGGAGDFSATAPRYPAVTFRNFIEDLPAYLDSIRVALIPDDLGGGFKMRALTLAALRVPILGLRSAMVGTTFVPNLHYHAVDTLEEMASSLPSLMDDFQYLNNLQEAAYNHCLSNFDWNERGIQLSQFAKSLSRN